MESYDEIPQKFVESYHFEGLLSTAMECPWRSQTDRWKPSHRISYIQLYTWKTDILAYVLMTSYHQFTVHLESSSYSDIEKIGIGKGPHRDRVFIFELGYIIISQINNIKLHAHIYTEYSFKYIVSINDISKWVRNIKNAISCNDLYQEKFQNTIVVA